MASELLDVTPLSDRRPVLLWAAIHDLVLAGAEHPLSAWYPTVGGTQTDVTQLGRALASFLTQFAAELSVLLGSRVVQTNEVGRSAALVPALAWIQRRVPGEPLHLLEVGASAGLNLLADRFRVELGGAGFGPPDSNVIVRAESRGDDPAIGSVAVTARLGVDRSPVDLTDQREHRWLRACVWADDVQRFERLSAALELALEDPPTVRVGDAVADLAAGADELPADGHLVVFHSWVLSYLSPTRRGEFIAEVRQLAERRPLTWLAMELRDDVPELPSPVTPLRRPGATELVAVDHSTVATDVTRLAELHPHGTWVDWSISR